MRIFVTDVNHADEKNEQNIRVMFKDSAYFVPLLLLLPHYRYMMLKENSLNNEHAKFLQRVDMLFLVYPGVGLKMEDLRYLYIQYIYDCVLLVIRISK